jgi:hypothetical protein
LLRRVAQNDDAVAVGLCIEQFQFKLFTRLEQRRAAAEHQRIERDTEFVDQPVRHQRRGQTGAACWASAING